MVINIGWLKNKQYDDVRNDIAAVKAAVGSGFFHGALHAIG